MNKYDLINIKVSATNLIIQMTRFILANGIDLFERLKQKDKAYKKEIFLLGDLTKCLFGSKIS